ncbi:hypothetical protein [Pseudomonas viridiflava]|uniref:hypothetical protein n=1 Tax=Pseudomonas viridiflava TaxID=33069 RepID=UPI0013CE8DCB|nr:hypothetical protein [Pseudomonas viridiflava]
MQTPTGFEKINVESSCGLIISCSYLDHPAFDRSKNLWQSLHYVFVQYCPSVSYANVYLLRSAINTLLDHLTAYNAVVPVALQATQYTDITSELFNGYVSYLNKNKKPLAYAEKLRSAMKIVAQNTGNLPMFLLPAVKSKSNIKTEPLTDPAYYELSDALKTHVDILKDNLAYREIVEAAEPYDFEQVMREIYPARNRGHVYQWYQYMESACKKITRLGMESKFRATDDEELLTLCGRKDMAAQFRKLYETESAPYLLDPPINPFELTGTGMAFWAPETARTLKTLLLHGFPFSKTLEELDIAYNRQVLYNVESCDDILKLLIHKYTWGNRHKCYTPPWDEVMAKYYPTPLDMTAIVVFIMIQSGWNREVVLAIDGDDFEHPLTGAIHESMRVVFSEKNKSQGLGKPYEDPKQITANSNRDNPYSIYSLITLAGQLAAPLRGIPFDTAVGTKKWVEMNDLFLCLRGWGEWQGRGGRHTSMTNPKTYRTAVAAFLAKYPVYENGRRLSVEGDIGRRLRPTWVKFQRKTNPLSLLSLQMGHVDEETTDIYYDSSGEAMQERRENLRSALEDIMHLLRTRQFQGLLGEQASLIANAKPRIFHIPGKERPLWGCRNQAKPSWPGSERQIPSGQKCTAIDKCLGCEQVWITEDSLPFLFERLQHLEDELGDLDESSFSARLISEKDIIEYLIDSWDDDDAIRSAERYQRKNSPLLPRDLASLRLIFQEENVDSTHISEGQLQ